MLIGKNSKYFPYYGYTEEGRGFVKPDKKRINMGKAFLP